MINHAINLTHIAAGVAANDESRHNEADSTA
jgi:hypothetical protein